MFYLILALKRRRKRASEVDVSDALPLDNATSRDHLPFGLQSYKAALLVSFQSSIGSKQHPDSTSHYHSGYYHSTNQFTYAGVAIGVIALIAIVGFLLYRLLKHFSLYSVAPERMPDLQPECNHPNCGQYCTMATNSTNSPENTVYNINSSFRILSAPGFLPTNSTANNNNFDALDLPPPYTSVVNRDKKEVPPSYSEALSYMSADDLLNFYKRKTLP